SHSDKPPEWLVLKCHALKLQLVTRSAEYLGVIFTFNESERTRFVRSAVDEAIADLQKMRHELMDAQICHRLLQFGSSPRLMHVLRITAPSAPTIDPARSIGAELQRLDDAVLTILADKLSIKPESMLHRRAQALLPARFGGLGISSAADIHSAAYLASWLSAVRDLPQQLFNNYVRAEFPQCLFNGKQVPCGAVSAVFC